MLREVRAVWIPPALEFIHASLTQTMSALDDGFEIALMYSKDAIWSTRIAIILP